MRKNFFKILIVFILIMFSLSYENITLAFATDEETTDAFSQLSSQTHDIANDFDYSALDEYLKTLTEDENLFFAGGTSFKNKIFEILSGEFSGGFDSVWQAFINLFFDSLVSFLPALALIVGVAILSSFFASVKTKQSSIGEIVFLICFGVIASVITKFVCTSIYSVVNILNAQTHISEIIFPILLTLVASMGGEGSAAVYQPAVLIFSGGVLKLFSTVLISLFIFSFVFSIISSFSNKLKFKKFADFFGGFFKWIIGIVFFLFMGYLALQGITSSVFDSMKIKTAKFAVKNYVPLLGGYLSEGFDFILSGLLMVKNAVGVAGILLIFGLIIPPLLSMIIFSLGLRLAGAICESICDEKITSFLTMAGKSISLLIVLVLGASFMFLIIIGLIILTLNGVAVWAHIFWKLLA